jgi:hypothetical protein
VAAAVALERPRLRALSAVAGAVTAAAVVVAAAGFAGPYLTDGYADVVAAGAAAAAAALLLTADTGSGTTAAGVGCLLAAGLTKDEGLVAALIISVALAARRWLADRRLRALALPCGLVAVLLVWPMVVLARGGPHGSILAGGGAAATGAGPDRLAATAHALAGRLELVPVLLAVTALAVLLRPRRAGGPVWLWVVLAADVLALAATYVLGKSPITWWLATSVDRVVILPQLLVLLIAASLVAVVLEARPRPGPAVRPSSRPESELVR